MSGAGPIPAAWWAGVAQAAREGRVAGAIMRLERPPCAASHRDAALCADAAEDLRRCLAAGCYGLDEALQLVDLCAQRTE